MRGAIRPGRSCGPGGVLRIERRSLLLCADRWSLACHDRPSCVSPVHVHDESNTGFRQNISRGGPRSNLGLWSDVSFLRLADNIGDRRGDRTHRRSVSLTPPLIWPLEGLERQRSSPSSVCGIPSSLQLHGSRLRHILTASRQKQNTPLPTLGEGRGTLWVAGQGHRATRSYRIAIVVLKALIQFCARSKTWLEKMPAAIVATVMTTRPVAISGTRLGVISVSGGGEKYIAATTLR